MKHELNELEVALKALELTLINFKRVLYIANFLIGFIIGLLIYKYLG